MDGVFEVLRDFLKERQDIDPAKITPDATLEELGIDSLMMMELFFEFEEKLGMDLDEAKEVPKTIGELVDIVKRLGQPKI